MPAVAHLYSHDGSAAAAVALAAATTTPSQVTKPKSSTVSVLDKPTTVQEMDDESQDRSGEILGREAVLAGGGGGEEDLRAARSVAKKLLASTTDTRKAVMNMGTVVQQEAKRNKRFKFFNDERWAELSVWLGSWLNGRSVG